MAERPTQRAKEQAGTIDPGMESVKTETVAGEGKAATSKRSSYGENAAARWNALKRKPEKNGIRGANRQGARRSEAQCSVRLHARGEQGWESGHLEPFLFGVGPARGFPPVPRAVPK